ncbi:hypothetical protein J3R82DRAFT_7206 [Butyriboletus roseoflavus]|nr:hypothetical protein J3R82DRAFT_7206 [Butyriboletus roseoflavus]
MLARSVQPDVVSLFSSTGSDPLGLFSVQVDGSLPSDSFIHLLNDSTSLPAPPPPAALITAPSVYRDQHTDTSRGHQLNQTVLHLQSPTLRKTFIQCPPSVPSHGSVGDRALGLTHTWLHVQVRNLGRDWSFEVGIVDKTGRRGTVRCSTFQVHLFFFFFFFFFWIMRVKSPTLVRHHGTSPLLHLPLAFPPSSSSPLTAWSTIALDLPKFVPQFASLAHIQSSSDLADDHHAAERGGTSDQVPLPSGTYSHLAFIKIYATCRLRRIWLSESAPITRTTPWEFELYGD